LTGFSAIGQIQQAWVARYNNGITNGTNQAVKMVLDSAGNIYVTGLSQNVNSNLGYVTIKYAPNGNQLWTARYDSTNYPTATPAAMALDSSNNVLVTGNALTVKYDSNGNQLWTAPYAGTALAVATNGNAWITGFGTNFDTVTLSPSGTNLWLQTFPGSCAAAVGQAIVADTSGNFYVAGAYPNFCETEHGNTYVYGVELIVIKYSWNGSQIWTNASEPEDALTQVEGAAVDSMGNFYVVLDFYHVEPYMTLKYSTTGSLVWMAFNPTGDLFSQSRALGLDKCGSVLVTGANDYYDPNRCYGTYKLSTNGLYLWTNLYPSVVVNSSVATSIEADQFNNSYVTGYSSGTNSGNDIVTIKYDANGTQVWLQRYNGPGNGNDAGNAIAVDNNGNVYVTGYDTTTAGGTEMVTIKYSPVSLQRRSDGTVLLQAQGSPGESFDIQASSNLESWLDLGSVTANSNGLMQFTDSNAPNYNARFYVTSPQ
jgi:hypothetical protein